MSIKIMNSVFYYDMKNIKTDKGQNVPDSTAKFVLLALADHSNDNGEGAYPSIDLLCRKTSMSRGTICNALNALRHNEFIRYEGESKKHTSNYTILVARLSDEVQPPYSAESSRRTLDSLATEHESSLTNHQYKPSPAKKLDLVDGMIYFAKEAKNQKIEEIEEVLNTIDKRLKMNCPRDSKWQGLAKWILTQTNPTLDKWLDWYLSDPFRRNGVMYITPEKIRNFWRQASTDITQDSVNNDGIQGGFYG